MSDGCPGNAVNLYRPIKPNVLDSKRAFLLCFDEVNINPHGAHVPTSVQSAETSATRQGSCLHRMNATAEFPF